MGSCCAAENNREVTETSIGKKKVKKGRKGRTLTKNEVKQFTEEVQDEEEEDLWSNVSDFESDDETDEKEFKKDTVTLERKGKTKDLFRKDFMNKVIKYCTADVRDTFKKLGAFQFR